MNEKVQTRKIVGILQNKITNILNSDLPNAEILFYSGLRKHIKKKHKMCLKYMENIEDIIQNPDYVGINPDEPNSVELVKVLNDNVLVSINLSSDTEEKYLFVSSIYDISDGKLNNRLNSGRLKTFS